MSDLRELLGRKGTPVVVNWSSDDALLYALGCAASYPDPATELAFTTENTADLPQRVLPTFATVLGQRAVRAGAAPRADVNRAVVVHAEQSVRLAGALSPSGELEFIGQISAVYDKGSGAVIETSLTGRDGAGAEVVSSVSAIFVRGAGGFGGDRGPSRPPAPEGEPDVEISRATAPNQALLYRLCGDRNPLHSDPSWARRSGFEKPILHGMCSFGVTARALVSHADSLGREVSSVTARFSAPVISGDVLTTQLWTDGGETARFRVRQADGTVVLDAGTCQFDPTDHDRS